MNKFEANEHPSVKPLLEKWREARNYEDLVYSDRRYSWQTRQNATKKAREAETDYDAAIEALYKALKS